MTETRFEPSRELILVEAKVYGPLGSKHLTLVLDTGASLTLLVPSVLDELGYNPREGEALTAIHSPIGREVGYRIRVQKLEVLGQSLSDFPVLAHELGDEEDIDGLLGLNFLQNFNVELRFREGRILVEPCQ